MATHDLAAWLLERIGEDERRARGLRGPTWSIAASPPRAWGDDEVDTELLAGGKPIARFNDEYGGYLNALHVEHWDPARALAECEAKRSIIWARHGALAIAEVSPLDPRAQGVMAAFDLALRRMALVYANRSGYREEWRPSVEA
jgi:hypothetical protein